MAECQWLTPVLLGSSRSWSGPPTAALPIRWPSLERDGAILVQLEFIEPLVTGGKGVGPQQSMGSMNHANARRSSAARVGEERADTFGSFRAAGTTIIVTRPRDSRPSTIWSPPCAEGTLSAPEVADAVEGAAVCLAARGGAVIGFHQAKGVTSVDSKRG